MNFKQHALTCLKKWIDLVQDHSKWVVVVILALAALSLYYAVNNLGMNTSTRDMLSEDLEWRQLDLVYEENFPQFSDNITVVIEADTPDQANDAAMALYEELKSETDIFDSVFYSKALPVFRQSALLFLDIEELQDLSDNLAAIQPFLSRLTEDQSIRGLFTMLDEIIDAIEEDDVDVNITPLLSQLNIAVIAALNNLPNRVSWQHLMNGENSDEGVNREFIILQPKMDYSSLLPAGEAIQKIHEIADKLNIERNIGAKIRLTGSAALEHEELLSVTRGVEIAMVLSLCAVTIIMFFGLGSVRLMIATLITLITGLVFTAAFAALTVGELNLISVAFAVLYIGLGVDFAIHYCLRYRELRKHGYSNRDAIEQSSLHVGSSMFLCAATTAIGFFAFIPTDYDGVAELGLISGSGMFISLVVTLTLLPALLRVMPYRFRENNNAKPVTRSGSRLLMFPFIYARKIRIASVIISVLLIGLLTRVEFDHNTLNLQDPENESVKTFKDLLTESNTSPWTSILLARNKQEARDLVDKIGSLSVVDDAVWLEDFVPDNQEEKLYIVEEIALLLGELPNQSDSPPVTDSERKSALQSYIKKLDTIQSENLDPEFEHLKYSINRFIEYLATLDKNERGRKLVELENNFLASLPGRIKALNESLKAYYISDDGLPEELVERWHNGDDIYLIQIFPRENIYDNGALRRFVSQLQKADPKVIGTPVVSIEASDAVVKAFQQAFTYAFIVITIFLLILLQNKKDTLYILIPMAMAAVSTCGASVLLNIPFNFANVIALPLILGIGVDSGIHILHRFRTAMPADNNLLATSSARAVVVSALTSICSIGNLAFSSHVGMASMGKLLTIGIGITLVCMLIVLPSLLELQIKKNKSATG